MVRTVRQSAYLKALGITEWLLKDSSSSMGSDSIDPIVETAPTARAQPGSDHIDSLDWKGLETQIAGCRLCELHRHRTQAVPGVGNQQAEWMIIGEAPGEQEDIQGEPFVGRAGLLLNNMLSALGLSREVVYIANIVKCRPPGNRDPHVDEIKACHGYLQRQIDLIQPDIILAVGRVAAQTLLQTDAPVGRMRGKVHNYAEANIPLVVTYHPAYLLRKPTEKYKAWADLKLAMEVQKQ